jgi:hypothetical protein
MKNLVLTQAVHDLAALLDYAGKCREATTLRGEVIALGRVRGLDTLGHIDRIRCGISALQKGPIPVEARDAALDVVSRIQRVLQN